MTTTVRLRKSYDVGYVNAGHGANGCAGAMACDTRSGEPARSVTWERVDELAAARAVRAYKGPSIRVDGGDRAGRRGGAGEIRAEVVAQFDLTVSAVRSVSVLHASYRVAAMQA